MNFKNDKEILTLYPDTDVNRDGGNDQYREGLPIIERHAVTVIIEHPTEMQVLLANWKQVEWCGFLTGGMEDHDSVEKAVQNEIREETGYKNISQIHVLDFTARGLFFHVIKNTNRLAHYHLFVAQLANLEKEVISKEEQKIAEFLWCPISEVAQKLTRNDMVSLWNFYLKSKHPSTE